MLAKYEISPRGIPNSKWQDTGREKVVQRPVNPATLVGADFPGCFENSYQDPVETLVGRIRGPGLHSSLSSSLSACEQQYHICFILWSHSEGIPHCGRQGGVGRQGQFRVKYTCTWITVNEELHKLGGGVTSEPACRVHDVVRFCIFNRERMTLVPGSAHVYRTGGHGWRSLLKPSSELCFSEHQPD